MLAKITKKKITVEPRCMNTGLTQKPEYDREFCLFYQKHILYFFFLKLTCFTDTGYNLHNVNDVMCSPEQ